MHKVIIKSGTLSAASALRARLRRANDNLDVADIVRLVAGPFTPVAFYYDFSSSVAHTYGEAAASPSYPSAHRSLWQSLVPSQVTRFWTRYRGNRRWDVLRTHRGPRDMGF
jgi:hypothetical protein